MEDKESGLGSAERNGGETEPRSFKERLRITLSWVVALVFAGLVISQAGNLLLMLFAGVLLALFLRKISDWVSDHSPIPPKWAFGAVVVTLTALLGVGGWLLSPQIDRQIAEVKEALPGVISDVRDALEQYSWGRHLLSQDFDASSLSGKSGSTIKRVTGAVSTTLTATANFLIILVFGLYLGAQPRLYANGFRQLFPPGKRTGIDELLEELRSTLAWWLLGRISSMAIIGVLTTVGLWLLGIPLAFVLGILAALLTFIPNIGPVISAIPAILLGFVQGPTTALHVGLLYAGIQIVESYLITPIIQKKAVSLPPMLTLSAQILMGIFFGLLGLIVATPMTAAALVLVRCLYVAPLNRRGPYPESD